jgi:hypothetical protein
LDTAGSLIASRDRARRLSLSSASPCQNASGLFVFLPRTASTFHVIVYLSGGAVGAEHVLQPLAQVPLVLVWDVFDSDGSEPRLIAVLEHSALEMSITPNCGTHAVAVGRDRDLG